MHCVVYVHVNLNVVCFNLCVFKCAFNVEVSSFGTILVDAQFAFKKCFKAAVALVVIIFPYWANCPMMSIRVDSMVICMSGCVCRRFSSSERQGSGDVGVPVFLAWCSPSDPTAREEAQHVNVLVL